MRGVRMLAEFVLVILFIRRFWNFLQLVAWWRLWFANSPAALYKKSPLGFPKNMFVQLCSVPFQIIQDSASTSRFCRHSGRALSVVWSSGSSLWRTITKSQCVAGPSKHDRVDWLNHWCSKISNLFRAPHKMQFWVADRVTWSPSILFSHFFQSIL
jgi:hypothetical protein